MNNDPQNSKRPIDVAKEGLYSALDIDSLGLCEDDFYYRDTNHRSIGFKTGVVGKTIDFFCNIFNLNCYRDRFDKKFRESISGDGNELTKNDALHSSSLCALLCFFNVSPTHPFTYDDITYNNAFFEVKNKVFKTPSNMDVVLTGEDKHGNDSILFIECKFSEFIGAGAYTLSSKYTDGEYGSIFEDFRYSDCKVFQYGLKQLVAHYIGITNFVNRFTGYDLSNYYEDERASLYKKDFKNVSFIEVLFEFKNKPDYITYKNEATQVFEALKSYENRRQSKIKLYGTTTYQELFQGENNRVLPQKVGLFYRLAEK